MRRAERGLNQSAKKRYVYLGYSYAFDDVLFRLNYVRCLIIYNFDHRNLFSGVKNLTSGVRMVLNG